MAKNGQDARRTHKHCKACAKHAHATPPRAHTRLYDLWNFHTNPYQSSETTS